MGDERLKLAPCPLCRRYRDPSEFWLDLGIGLSVGFASKLMSADRRHETLLTKLAINRFADLALERRDPANSQRLNARQLCNLVLPGFLILALLLSWRDVRAQELVLPTDVPRSPNAAARLLTKAQPSGLFKLGPFDFYPRLSGTVYYDDNINGSASNTLHDIAWTVAPGFSAVARNSDVEREKSLTFEYTPVFRFYADHDELNSIDHAGRVAGRWSGSKLGIGFDQAFLASSQSSPDVGGRVDQFTATSGLTSELRLGYKTSLQVDAALALADNETFASSRDWSNSDWLNYRLSPKLTIGAGVVLGYLDVERGANQAVTGNPDQTYEQLRARAVCFVNDKVNLRASAGAELRQYRGGAGDTLSPVWDLTGVVQPRRGTTLTLRIFQRYSSSALSADQNYLDTGVGATVAQRFFDRFVATIDGAYSRADYRGTVAGVSAPRLDNIYSVRGGLDAFITGNWTAGIFYSYQRDDSSDGLFSFVRNQFGVRSSWSF